MTSIADAAAFLAQQWPVFPCMGNKRPITGHGFHDAVTDPDAARREFRQPGAEMIGVPTGRASGLAVIDLDVKDGRHGLEWLAANEHRLPATRRHSTQSGGVHLLFRYPEGRSIGSGVGGKGRFRALPAGVDVRGNGGYIIAPPSPGYTVADAAMPAEMPAWLVEMLDPPETPRQPVQRAPLRPRTAGDGTPWGLAALARECAEITGATDGNKHWALNKAAFSIGGLVSAGELAEGPAFAALSEALDAIRHRCEDEKHAEGTLRTAFQQGMAQPRQAPPPRQVQHTVRVEIVAPPEPPPYEALPEWIQGDPEPDAEWVDPETGEILPAKPKPQPKPDAGLPLIYFADAQPNLDAADFIEGLLVDRAMSVIYGPSNCGKTFFATDLALHVAAGWAWRGRDVEQGGVIYVALEGSHGILNRVAAFRREHAIAADLPFAIIPVAVNLLDPSADADRVIAAIRGAKERMGMPVRWVVVDTLSRAMAGGNENSPEDMGALVTNGTRIQQEAECHVTWIHHSGKDQAQGARGHSLLRAATDTEIEISRADSESPSVARVTKQRDMPIEGEFVFRLRSVELGQNRRGKPVTSCIVEPDNGPAPAQAPKLSGGGHVAVKALQEAIAKHGQVIAGSDMPNLPAVHVDQWRREFYGRSVLDTQEAKKKAFQRGAKDAIDAQMVGTINNYAWIAIRKGNTQ